MLNSAITATFHSRTLSRSWLLWHPLRSSEGACWMEPGGNWRRISIPGWTGDTRAHPAFELAVEQDAFGHPVDRVRDRRFYVNE